MGIYQGNKPLSSGGKSPVAYAKEAGYIGTDSNFYSALADMPDHISSSENPHGTTASQVGAVASSEKGVANGIATLGADSLLVAAQRPKAGGLYRDDGTTTLEKSLTDISTDLANKAPAGYGLGTTNVSGASYDANNCTRNGWYICKVNTPNESWWYILTVANYSNAVVVQKAWHYNDGKVVECMRLGWLDVSEDKGGGWQPWEWVNPPMQLNTEYRTTERYQGKPVYTKLCGPVHGTATASTALELVNQFNIQYSVQETIVECKCLIGEYSENDKKLINVVDNETFNHSDTLYIRRTGMDDGYVRLEFLGYSGEIGFIAKIKYTKSTD